MKEELQGIAFQMISYIGQAKMLYMEAINLAEKDDFAVIEETIKKANANLVEAHKVHFGLIQQEADGKDIEFSLILIHAEDQLMTVEMFKEISLKIINIYKNMKKSA